MSSTSNPLAKLPAYDPSISEAAKSSLDRLKGALGDDSIGASAPCLAKEAQKKDYAGPCPICKKDHAIANTADSQNHAAKLLDDLKANGFSPEIPLSALTAGKMVGVLVCIDQEGNPQVLKAFSGTIGETTELPGWSSMVPIEDPKKDAELEKAWREAKKKFDNLDKELLADIEDLTKLERDLQASKSGMEKLGRRLTTATKDAQLYSEKLDRLGKDLSSLEEQKKGITDSEALGKLQSKIDSVGREAEKTKGNLKKTNDTIAEIKSDLKKLEDLKPTVEGATQKFKEKYLTDLETAQKYVKSLEKEMDDASAKARAYAAQARKVPTMRPDIPAELNPPNFEKVINNQKLSHNGQTGYCAAPKLLNEAMQKGLTPVSMTEFWVGPPLREYKEGDIVPSCNFCKSFIGFTLCGLEGKQESLKGKLLG
jgi:DNA repair exonuclease SbcCD ATPase subunit